MADSESARLGSNPSPGVVRVFTDQILYTIFRVHCLHFMAYRVSQEEICLGMICGVPISKGAKTDVPLFIHPKQTIYVDLIMRMRLNKTWFASPKISLTEK